MINPVSCMGNTLNSSLLRSQQPKLNRKILQRTSKMTNLNGPLEKSEAKKVVASFTAIGTGIAAGMAQVPGGDELALAANEVAMASAVLNGVYKFDLSKTVVKSLVTGLIGNRVGTYAFKSASKLFTWIPGLGNGLNAAVAGGTTAALGASIIAMAEDMDRARKNGQRLDDFIKKMEE